MPKKPTRTPEQRAQDYFKMLMEDKIKYIHITKRGTKEDREKTLELMKGSLSLLSIELEECRSRFTVRIKKEKNVYTPDVQLLP